LRVDFIQELTWRGLLQQSSDPALGDKLRAEPFTVYVGFDPTADSLHVGSLIPLLALVRAQRAGHRPIALVGGATGMVGDPSGKSEERQLLATEQLERNVSGIRRQLERVLDFGAGAQLVNNYDWLSGYGYLAFLRDVGKHFSVNMMLAKDSVRSRLEDREQGISYTEFSYMLIQAYDFLVLHDRFGCRLQVGGSDQWGNITAGIDLIRRVRAKEAYGLTMPLILTSSGQKFGKSEKGAVWLDAGRTSPYDFFQFFLRVEDRDAGRFLRYYTFLDEPAIAALEEQVRTAPQERAAQRALAREVTTLVHGTEEARKAEEAAKALHGGTAAADPRSLPHTAVSRGQLPLAVVDALVLSGLCSSKSDARRMIQGGGVYVNEARVEDVAQVIGESDVAADGVVVLRRGKKDKHVLLIEG
jgi:tyrosyl-tRNA synthetase